MAHSGDNRFGLIFYNLGKITLDEFFRFASESGFSDVEIPVHSVWNEKEESEAQGLKRASETKRLLESYGLGVAALSAANDFVVLDEEQITHQVARMKSVCRIAGALGTDLLRTEGGAPKESVPKDKWMAAMAECLKRCVPFIEKEGYTLAVDNHGHVTNDADLQVALFEDVGSERVAATLDTMNYRWAGHSLETVAEFYRKIAPYVRHVHFKDGTGSQRSYEGLALGEGEIDLQLAVDVLQDAGYCGVWTVEYEGKTDPFAGYRKGLAWLQEHV